MIPVNSPASHSKVSAGETLRAISSADATTSHVPAPPQTPTASRRRASIRTPRQVQAVLLSGRKVASAKKVLRKRESRDHTPSGLLRALSRTADFPPPTPDEANNNTRAPRPSLGASSSLLSTREDPEVEEQPYHIAYTSLPQPTSRSPSPSSSSLSTSSPDAPSSASQAAASLGIFQTASQPLPLQPNFNPFKPSNQGSFNPIHGTTGGRISKSQPLPSLNTLRGEREERRSEGGRSVEKGRRESRLSSVGGSPSFRVGGDRDGEIEDGEEEEGRRASRASERSFAFEQGEEDEEDVEEPLLSVRSSNASQFGNLPPSNLSPISRAAPIVVDLQRGLDDEFDFGDIGGGGGEEYEQEEEEEEEEGEERISWAAKGKYPVEIEKDTVIPGYEKEEEGEDESMEDEDEGYESQEVLPRRKNIVMPKAPSLTKGAAARKKRQSRKTQRYTEDGTPVPDLPKSRVKSLFQHFLGSNSKLEPDGLEAVMDASSEFFGTLMVDASAYAAHAGRKSLIHESDLVAMMYRQRILTDKCGLQALGRRFGLDRELQSLLDAMGPAGKGVGGTRGKGKKRGRTSEEGRGLKRAVMRREIEEGEEEEED